MERLNLIKGIDVILIEKIETGRNEFDIPTYEERETVVKNVLVAQPTTDDIVSNENLYGKKTVYTLAIPKGDTHEWKDTKIKFFGQTFRTFGDVIEGIEEMIPLRWNKKIHVERYE